MKKYLLIFCLIQIGLTSSIKAQDYEPLVRENAHWVVADYVLNPYYTNENVREYFTEGDTTVNSKLYKKVYKYDLTPYNGNYQPPYIRTGDPQLFGMLREDTVNKIVLGILLNPFTYDCFITEDTLFDFSVSLNDTLDLCIIDPDFGKIIIDQIYYYNFFGYNTKVISGGGIPILEGIGSDFGLFENIMIYVKEFRRYELLCYTRDDISNCDILTQTETHFVTDYKIFPNPSSDGSVTLSFQNTEYFEDMELKCFDVYGKEVYSEKVYQYQGESKIGVQDWKSGIFFVIIYSGGVPVGNSKFVVQ